MGDIKRKSNRHSRPRKLFDSVRIAAEGDIVKKYGLKNKKEIWKAAARVSELRTRAKKLIPKSEEEKQEFFARLQSQGLNVNAIAEVLALTTENLLERRLQTIVFKKGFTSTALGARQLITHKNVYVDGRLVNIPSFVVTKYLENKISIKERKAPAEKAEAGEKQ
jgi:small subunit ribosomal protein S4